MFAKLSEQRVRIGVKVFPLRKLLPLPQKISERRLVVISLYDVIRQPKFMYATDLGGGCECTTTSCVINQGLLSYRLHNIVGQLHDSI